MPTIVAASGFRALRRRHHAGARARNHLLRDLGVACRSSPRRNLSDGGPPAFALRCGIRRNTRLDQFVLRLNRAKPVHAAGPGLTGAREIAGLIDRGTAAWRHAPTDWSVRGRPGRLRDNGGAQVTRSASSMNIKACRIANQTGKVCQRLYSAETPQLAEIPAFRRSNLDGRAVCAFGDGRGVRLFFRPLRSPSSVPFFRPFFRLLSSVPSSVPLPSLFRPSSVPLPSLFRPSSVPFFRPLLLSLLRVAGRMHS